MYQHIAIIGAGASGLACAMTLAKDPEHFFIQVFDGNPKIGKKLAATGNGHGNLSNQDLSLCHYHGDVAYVEEIIGSFDINRFCFELGFLLRQKGSLYYPYSEQAKTVCQAFESCLDERGVQVILNTKIIDLKRHNNGYLLKSPNGQSFRADVVIVAGGGKAAQQFGSDGSCLDMLSALGVMHTPLAPSLVQLKTRPVLKRLKGCRFHGTFKLLRDGMMVATYKGEALITEDGLSGIAIMQLSRYFDDTPHHWQIECNLVDELNDSQLKKYYQQHPQYEGILQEKLAYYFNENFPFQNYAQFKKNLQAFSLEVVGTRGFESAQVTKGGVPLTFVDENLMIKTLDQLYLCGEILNIDGDCGGYNLHFAFASGVWVAKAIMNKNK